MQEQEEILEDEIYREWKRSQIEKNEEYGSIEVEYRGYLLRYISVAILDGKLYPCRLEFWS